MSKYLKNIFKFLFFLLHVYKKDYVDIYIKYIPRSKFIYAGFSNSNAF